MESNQGIFLHFLSARFLLFTLDKLVDSNYNLVDFPQDRRSEVTDVMVTEGNPTPSNFKPNPYMQIQE